MILILEDDETLGNALKEALSRAGHHVILCSRPDDALTAISKNKIDFIFCDCLLPQMTGLDFIERARQTYPSAKFKTILMSGIYTDKSFVQEATKRTQAVAFLKKPFNMDEVLKLTQRGEDSLKSAEVNTRKLLYQVFSNPSVTSRQKRKLIESIEEVSGFDLPFIYSLLVETKSSGYLNIYHANGTVSGITFCNGHIVGVDVEDKSTFLGEMLIQSGYAMPADVQGALRDKTNRRIGNYLIQSNQLSPHGFDLILAEQMNIRLSRTISEEKIRINFATSEVDMISPYIDSETLLEFLHDWIASKVSLNWLKSLYMIWSGYVIVASPSFRKDSPAFSMSLIKALDGFVDLVEKKMTLAQLLAVPGYNEKAVYKGVHFLLTRGLIVFEQKSSFSSQEEQLQALKKLQEDTKDMNDFTFVEYMDSCTMSAEDIKSTLREFLSLLGPQPQDEKSESFKIWTKLKSKAEAAVDASADLKQRTKFKEAHAKSDAEAKLRAGRLMEDARQALQLNQYTKSSELLAQVAKLNLQIQQFHIFSAWTKLGQVDPARKAMQLKEIELEIMQIPPDERYDALFPFVMGLFYKAKGDLVSAKKSFEKSIALDPGFVVARREMSILEVQGKKQDILKMDLKEMVSGFFKKKA